MKKVIKNSDLFSLPFQFQLSNGDKDKKTLFGGLLSLTIICLSLSYLIYLCNLYFGNKLQPIITFNSINMIDHYSLKIYENTLSIRVQLPNGQDIAELEKDGKVYIQALALYTEMNQYGKEENLVIPTKPCQDNELTGYYCLDFSNFNQGEKYFKLNYYPDQFEKEKLQILLMYCHQKYLKQGQECAKPDEIINKVQKIATQVFIKISTLQYSPSSREFEKRIKQERYYFSKGLVSFSKIHMQKTIASVSSGFIVESTKIEESFLSDYKRFDQTNTQQFLLAEYELDLIAVCQIFASDIGLEQKIQYPQFTFIFAQFTSVFNSLLFAGIICKLFAESEIVKDFIELQLKFYYKKTAIDLISKFEKQKYKKYNYRESKLSIYNLYQKIQDMRVKHLSLKEFNLNPFQTLKQQICQCLRCFSKKKKDEILSQEKVIYETLANKSNQAMNIFEIQKELTKIKMMLRLLLSVEQYSAIQLCGININIPKQVDNQFNNINQQQEETVLMKEVGILQIDNDKSINNFSGQKDQTDQNILSTEKLMEDPQQELEILLSQQQSHLDKIDLLERDQNYFQECLERYFVNNRFKSELDQRILGSMIGTAEQKLSDIRNIERCYQDDKLK